MALPKLTPAELESLASDSLPRISALPLRPRRVLEPAPPRPSRRTRADKAADRAPVVSRRMRRHNNDMLLAVTAAETDALPVSHDDMRTLFERRSSSCWSVLHQNEASRDIGDAFVEMGRRDECESLQEARVYAEVKLARVDGRLRTLIKERASLVKPLVREVEERVVDLPLGGSVVLRLPHALSRMVAHCVAQFHRLGHRSFGDGDHRFTVIHARKAVCGSVRLMDVLA